jgi:hypothetical protein
VQTFIPFEDDWDALENLRLEELVPFHVSLLSPAGVTVQRTDPSGSSVLKPVAAPGRGFDTPAA